MPDEAAAGVGDGPTAAVVVCTDRALAAEYGFPPDAAGLFVDVGTATATILLAAHSLGIGAGPVTSFSRAAAGVVLRLPDGWVAELIVCLGHPEPTRIAIAPQRRLRWQDLTRWAP